MMPNFLPAPWRNLQRARPSRFHHAFPEDAQADRPLAPCPDRPNCVSSLEGDDPRTVAPFPYALPRAQAVEALKEAMGMLPRVRLTAQTETKLRFECRSRFFGFVDEVDFWLDDAAKLIHIRSAARKGRYDFGVNRARVERLRRLLTPLLLPAPSETIPETPDENVGPGVRHTWSTAQPRRPTP